MQPVREQPVHKRIPLTKSVPMSAMKRTTSEEEQNCDHCKLKREDLTPKYFEPGWEVEAEQPRRSSGQPEEQQAVLPNVNNIKKPNQKGLRQNIHIVSFPLPNSLDIVTHVQKY